MFSSQVSWGLLLHYLRRFYEVYITVRAMIFVAINQVVPPLTKFDDPELKDKDGKTPSMKWCYTERSQSVTREFKI